MSKTIDRVLSWLLILGGAGHTYGMFATYRWLTMELVFGLGTTLAIGLLGAANLIRVRRPADRALAWVCVVGCVAWAALSVAFGVSIQAPLDPRALFFAVNSLALAAFSVRTLTGAPNLVHAQVLVRDTKQ